MMNEDQVLYIVLNQLYSKSQFSQAHQAQKESQERARASSSS